MYLVILFHWHILTMSAFCMCVCAYRYRYQLEAFVDKVRGRDPEHWFDAQDSITNMEWIEAIYEEVSHTIMLLFPISFQLVSTGTFGTGLLINFLSQTGLGSRPPSTAEVPQTTGT